MIGSRVGHYVILAKLGEGGMGVVYQARDERLQRVVALKFLPARGAGDPAERERFLQEARAASALNHPNICTVHAIEDHDGAPFIVMEYVDGETLRARIAREQVPLDQAVAWAIQIGDALQEAHARGVVHRDVKTENVMLTRRGQVKVMDFGLARLKGLGQATHTLSTLGTLAYMAPEQIREGRSDARSDLYAFGVVLYELLTGRQPFTGEQQAAVMYAILNTEPAPLEALRPGLASGWQHLIDRALEKQPDDRYQSIGDMVIELRRLQRDLAGHGRATAPAGSPTALDTGAASTGPISPMLPTRSTRSRRLTAGVLVAILAGATAAWIALAHRPPRINPAMTFRTLDIPATDISYPGMSRDGKWVAYPAADANDSWDLYFMNVGGGEPRRITSDSLAMIGYVDVSPDGSQIAYSGVESHPPFRFEIRVVPVLGGASHVIGRDGNACRWSPDGSRIGFINRPSGRTNEHLEFWSVRPDGGDLRREYVDMRSGPRGRVSFDWSPDGRSIAWLRTFPDESEELFVVPLGGGRERQLTHDHKNIDEVCWTPQNDIVFSSNRGGNSNLWIVHARGGSPTQLTKGAGPDLGMRVSADGRTLLYMQQQRVDRMWIVSLERSQSTPVPYEHARLSDPELSVDGSLIAVAAADPDPIHVHNHLVVMTRDGSNRRMVGAPNERVLAEQWAPSGTLLAYASLPIEQPPESSHVYVVDARGSDAPRLVALGSGMNWKDADHLMVRRGGTLALVALADGAATTLSRDSVFVFDAFARTHRLEFDARAGHDSVFVLVPAPGGDRRIALGSPDEDPMVIAPSGDFMLRLTHDRRVLAIHLPTMKEAPAPPFNMAIRPDLGAIRWDDREFIALEPHADAKLVLVEHLR